MENILYLDDYINLYHKKINEIICKKPYKNTLQNGKIIDRKKFIKNYLKLKEEYKITNSFLSEEITVIINSSYTIEDTILLKDILEELNYKKINLIKETNIIKLEKNTMLINYNYKYFYLYYINELGNIDMKVYLNDYINRNLIINILSIINKNKLILIGKNINELINILSKTKYNYYYYEETETILIKLLLNNKIV